MATQKELKAAAKQAKKDIAVRNKKEEEEKIAKSQRTLLAIKTQKDPIVEITEEVKKTPIKSKKVTEEEEIEELRHQLEVDRKKEKARKNKDSWDVKIGDEIDCFDPELSYELSGYRPITMTKGLDFDPLLFTEAGRIYEETGHYCTYQKGKLAFDFWSEQMRRCKEGYTVGRYTVTGDHYFFLNFYRLLNVANIKKAAAGRDETFPDFFAKQYEYFHYIDLCEKLGKDVIALKARGVGFSEIGASLGVRIYTTTKQSLTRYTAYTEKYVKDVISKCWAQLEFLNTHTDGGMKRVRMKKNSDMERRASKVDREGNEFGHMATIEGLTVDNPRKLRGGRVERLIFEEAGSNPILVKTYNQAEALVEILGKRLGTRVVWGTGGDSGPSLAGLATMFYDPNAFKGLPYRHNHTQSGEYVYTAFFIPAYTMHIESCDSRGVCNEIDAKIYYNSERVKKSNNAQNLLEYKSEYCFYPEEALIREGENRFDQVKLSEQISNIELHKIIEQPKNAKLSFIFNPEIGKPDMTKMPDFEFTDQGKLQIMEMPMQDENKIAYNNLYVAGIDSIDADDTSSTGQKDVSKFAIVILRRQLGLLEPKIVAVYHDRPKDVREAYDNAIKLLMWYNCKAVLESSRVSITTYFKEHNKLNYLFYRPKATQSDIKKGNSKMVGVPATVTVIEHYLDLIEMFLNDYWYGINFLNILQELTKYSYENKKKFDLVAALGMALLGDEELMGKIPKTATRTKNEWKDIGYYYDERGLKRFGVIPKQHEKLIGNYDWIGT